MIYNKNIATKECDECFENNKPTEINEDIQIIYSFSIKVRFYRPLAELFECPITPPKSITLQSYIFLGVKNLSHQ